jgi:hypothetical protein
MKKTYQELTINSHLTRNPAWSNVKLRPLPIYRDEAEHKYVWEPTGEVLAYSTTQISGAPLWQLLKQLGTNGSLEAKRFIIVWSNFC